MTTTFPLGNPPYFKRPVPPTAADLPGWLQTEFGSVQRGMQITLPGNRTVTTGSDYLDNNKVVNLRDYGLLPTNSAAQNVAGIQRAIADQSGPVRFVTPAGFYNFDSDIVWPTGYASVFEGEGRDVSRFAYTGSAPLTSMFRMSSPGVRYEGNQFRNFGVIGNGLLGSIVDNFPTGNPSPATSGYGSHTLVEGIGCQGHTGWAFRLNAAYSSRFLLNKIFSGTGGGIACYGTADSSNNIGFYFNLIYALGGLGAAVGNGLDIDFFGNGIEVCALGGIYGFDLRGLTVDGYFERNGAATFAIGGVTKKAEILLSASPTYGALDLTGQLQCIKLSGIHGTGFSTGAGTRANTTAYLLGTQVVWSSGTTVWDVTTAGTTAGAAPSIVGKVVGDTVVDGTVTWTMRSLTTGVDAFVFANKGDDLTLDSIQMYDATKYGSTLEIFEPTPGTAVVNPVSVQKCSKNTVAFTNAGGPTTVSGARWIQKDFVPILRATAMPTTDSYVAGDYVVNTTAPNPIVGVAGSRYIVKGWNRITTGSAHVLNTDWTEDRALTGT